MTEKFRNRPNLNAPSPIRRWLPAGCIYVASEPTKVFVRHRRAPFRNRLLFREGGIRPVGNVANRQESVVFV